MRLRILRLHKYLGWGASGGVQFGRSPVKDIPNFAQKFIPIAVHGDGTPAMGAGKSWSKMMDLFSWSSVLFTGRTEVRQFLIFGLHSSLRLVGPEDSLETCFQVLKWSLDACYEGCHPTLTWDGKPNPHPKAVLHTFPYISNDFISNATIV